MRDYRDYKPRYIEGRLDDQLQQSVAGMMLMTRFHEYAESIGCATHDGLMSDCIEVFTDEQADKLAAWWKANTHGNAGRH